MKTAYCDPHLSVVLRQALTRENRLELTAIQLPCIFLLSRMVELKASQSVFCIFFYLLKFKHKYPTNFYLLIKLGSVSVPDYNRIITLNQKMHVCIHTLCTYKHTYNNSVKRTILTPLHFLHAVCTSQEGRCDSSHVLPESKRQKQNCI